MYERIRNRAIRPEPINHNATQTLNEIKNEIDGLLNPSAEAAELAVLLANTNLQVRENTISGSWRPVIHGFFFFQFLGGFEERTDLLDQRSVRSQIFPSFL